MNNAGICGSQPIEHATLDDFDHYWRVHLGGPVNTVKAAWPHMVAQRCGKIILTTPVSGLFGLRGQATQDPGCPKQMEEPPCRLRLLRQRSSGWQATGVQRSNHIYNGGIGAIQRIAIVMGSGFYDPHLTPESIVENYTKVESIEGFSEPAPFEPSS